MRDTGWFKSSRSGAATDNCVEVRITEVTTWVRDSKCRTAVLSVDLPALLTAIKSGRLDRF
jgi:uncharacterized protein DUF397